jgi:hypothetical protein
VPDAYLLAVGFVSPALAAAGALLVCVPIVIHLLSRRHYKVIDWAAMDFLLAALRRMRRRMRIEQLLLLATRCAVIALAGLALSRPFGCNQSSMAGLIARHTGLHVIVIDNAMSMAYEADRPDARTNLDQAKLIAKQLIDRMSAGGEAVALVTAAAPARAVTASPVYDLQAARRAVDSIPQTALPADLSGALARALEIARADPGEPAKELVLITDSARGAWEAQPDELRGVARQAAATFKIVHFDLARPGVWNQTVADLGPAGSNMATRNGRGLSRDSRIARLGFENDFAAVVRGYGPPAPAAIQWHLDGQPLGSPDSIRPDLDTAPITQAQAHFATGGPHTIGVQISGGDRLPIDDARLRVVNVASDVKVLIVEGDRGIGALSGSGAFLELALSPPGDSAGGNSRNGAGSSNYLSVERVGDLEFPSKVLSDYAAIALANVGDLSAPQADRLAQYAKAGGALLIFMGEQVSAESYNATLLSRGLLPGPLTRRIGSSEQQAHFFDFKPDIITEPLLSAFAGQAKSGLDTAQVFTYWQIDPATDGRVRRVLDYLPDATGHRDPAITVQDLGRGHIIFFSTTADAQWTTFPAKPAYVALMHELVAGTIDAGDQWMNLLVGQPLVVPQSVPMTSAPILRDSQHQSLPLTAAQAGEQFACRSEPLIRPGLYTLWTGVRDYPIAVNVAAAASDLRPLDGSALRRALGDVDVTLQGDQVPPAADAADTARDYGRALLFAMLLLAAAETLMAKRFGHHRTAVVAG